MGYFKTIKRLSFKKRNPSNKNKTKKMKINRDRNTKGKPKRKLRCVQLKSNKRNNQTKINNKQTRKRTGGGGKYSIVGGYIGRLTNNKWKSAIDTKMKL
tara:strand:+ start:1576 stop:1872 length:297 start_codon:yes stop_codon:yes gene_type:complete